MHNTVAWHGHAPPEARKINYNEYDSSLDIFSFGVVMVQMVVKADRIACSVDRDVYIEEIKNAKAMSPPIQPYHMLCSNKQKQ